MSEEPLTPCDRPFADCKVCLGGGKFDCEPCPSCVWRRWFEDNKANIKTPEEIEAGRTEERGGCPCLHIKPCHPHCTCVNPVMSRGCRRCCTYGSPEQQRAAAERLVKTEMPCIMCLEDVEVAVVCLKCAASMAEDKEFVPPPSDEGGWNDATAANLARMRALEVVVPTSDEPWEWDSECSRCFATLSWEGDPPECEEDALCHDCAWKELQERRRLMGAPRTKAQA